MKRPAPTQFAFFALLLRSAIAPIAVAAQQAAADPFIWLEDVDSKRSMDWVNSHNAATVAVLGATPLYQSIYDRTKQILDSKDRIAYPRIVGDKLYNFWQDADHKRGIWLVKVRLSLASNSRNVTRQRSL